MRSPRRLILALVLTLTPACAGDDHEDDAGAALEPGDLIWTRSLAADAFAASVNPVGELAVVGEEGGDLWLGRFSDAAEPLWSRTEPDLWGIDVVDDLVAIYVAAVPKDEVSTGGRVLAYDTDGGHLWTLDDLELEPRALAPGPGSGVFVVGAVEDTSSIFIERVLPDGEVQWVITVDELEGTSLAADATDDGGVVIAGSRDDGTWWVHTRSGLGDPEWTTELGQVEGPAFVKVTAGNWIYTSVLTQGEGSRGSVAALSPKTGEVHWIQPLDVPPTDLALGSASGPLLLSILITTSIRALDGVGANAWSIEQDPACPRTYGVVHRSESDAILLRGCAEGGSQLAAFRTR